MGLIDKLLRKNPEDEKGKRLEKTKKELTSFLDNVNAEYHHYVPEQYSQGEEYDIFIEEIGKMFYEILEDDYPKYKEITEKETPLLIKSKEKRNKLICDMAKKFLEFTEIISYHKGLENLDYGILGSEIPTGELSDQNKIFVQDKWKLPAEKLDNLENYSFAQAYEEIKQDMKSFIKSIKHSDVSNNIKHIKKQSYALNQFKQGICQDIEDLITELPRIHKEREQGNLTAEAETSIKELPRKYINTFNEEYKKLIKLGIDESNIPKEIRYKVKELGQFVAGKKKYQSQRMEKIEREEREERQKRLAQERKDYETKSLSIVPAHHPTPKTGVYVDDIERFMQTRKFQKNRNGNSKE